MREFFRGWRRKTGCVALGLACATMGIWIRSYYYQDFVATRDSRFVIVSQEGYVSWDWRTQLQSTGLNLHWGSQLLPPGGGVFFKHFSTAVRYQSVTLILTLLAAYLILWKPRKRTGAVHA